jgi:ATP-binding protein involved in chromosome partitioning
MKALGHLLDEVAWGDLDVLVVDMPPGTGDTQLTLSQKVLLSGAVIVTTPQDVALADAIKGVAMFRKVDVPVLGIVENMSYFACPHCGERTDIFGHGGGRAEAEKMGVPFLGEIALDPAIRDSGDTGTPVTAADPDSPRAGAFREIAARVAESLERAPRPADS